MLGELQQEERGHDRQRLERTLELLGRRRFAGWGSTTGNVLADFLLRDMTWGFSEVLRRPQCAAALARPRDVRRRFVADLAPRLTFDYGLRYSLFYNSYTADDRISSFVPALFNPALGADACNGLLIPPDTNLVSAGWRGRWHCWTEPLADEPGLRTTSRHASGIAWDVNGNGKTAVRAGLGQFFLRERLSPGLQIAGNPPFTRTISGIRSLDSTDGTVRRLHQLEPSAPRARGAKST